MIAIVAALVVGCGPPADPKHPSPPPRNPSTAAVKPLQNNAPGPSASAQLPVVGCPTPTCAFHAGAGAYFTCLSGSAGACFHFGPACAPSDLCMYDPGDRTYKKCAQASEGACTQWGAPCAPASKCMFNPSDGLNHQCDEITGGGCKRYGALCAP